MPRRKAGRADCDRCARLAPNNLQCTGGYVPGYGWCDPVKGDPNCPMFSPK